MIREQITEALSDVQASELLFVRAEIKHLPSILRNGEVPERIIPGRYKQAQGILCATDRRLVFFDKGLLGTTISEYAYRNITSIEHGKGLMWAELIVTVAGNADKFDQIHKHHLGPFLEHLHAKMEASQAPQQAAPTADIAEQLERLIQMRDAGDLSPEEFAAAKSRLVGS